MLIGNARFHRGARAKERRQRRALVVGRAASKITVAFLRHHKRLGVPGLGFFRSRLHVHVVVDSHRRQVFVVPKTACTGRVAIVRLRKPSPLPPNPRSVSTVRSTPLRMSSACDGSQETVGVSTKRFKQRFVFVAMIVGKREELVAVKRVRHSGDPPIQIR